MCVCSRSYPARKHSTILSSAACPSVSYLSTLSYKQHDFRIKFFNIHCVFWFPLQLLSNVFLILKIIQRDNIIVAFRNFSKASASYSPHYKCACSNLPQEERWKCQTINNHSALQYTFRKPLLITDQNIFGIRFSSSHGLQLVMSYL